MNKTMITIVLPVYNVEKYIRRCIDSILNQTFNNYELIIIDDGSTDNSGYICNQYKKLDNRIKIVHQDNKGLSNARNKGIELSNSKYITFIDSDDYIDNKYLEVLYSIMINNNADIVICNHIKIKENENNNATIIDNYNEEIITKEETYRRMNLGINIGMAVWSKLYKTDIFKNNKFLNNKLYEDIFIINDIIESTNKIVVTNYNGYYYLLRNNSITNSPMDYKHLDLINATKKYKDYMIKYYSNISESSIRRYVLANYLIYRKAIQNKLYKKEYKEIRKEILKYKKNILKSNLYSTKIKLQTIILLFGNNIYKLFYLNKKRIINK